MNDLRNASLFFLIFVAVLLVYGFVLAQTGDKSLLPMRAALSISGPDDVKYVGRITIRVALVIGLIALVGFVASGWM